MDTETLAYIAGIIDGEGCISIGKETRKNTFFPSYCLNIRIRTTSFRLIEYIYNEIGGTLNDHSIDERKESYKDTLEWKMESEQALQLLEQLSPYLVIKKKEVEIARIFRNTYGSRKRAHLLNIMPVREQCYKIMRQLKTRSDNYIVNNLFKKYKINGNFTLKGEDHDE